MKIKNYRDFWAGILFMAFGLAFIVFARDYNMAVSYTH
ncbi:MAG: tripartite tricarboxylate transporter TctB family protein, partial [Betaproteobacteria bacterium]|nr:tripartite tricarboxylate transporter TctB family protein [Betaproteobacteria bacterium]